MTNARRVGESQITIAQVMLPGDANPWGNVHGGVIMRMVDTAAGVCATRHTHRRSVTARIDSMSFLQPVSVGDLVTCRASVNDVGTTSLEVGVRVDAEDLIRGVVRHVSSAYLVFVALDDQGHPVPVPPLVVETAEERRRMAEAKLRRAHRQRGDQAMQALRKPPTEPLPPAWRQPGSAFSVIGHRGAAGLAPENTLPSFQLAVALGADAVEMDVRLSRDGVPVVIHDATVDRTTDGHGEVARLSVAEIQALDARGPFRDHASPTRIPTLDEVLAWASGRTRVVVELKSTEQPELVDQTLARLREYRLLDAALVISFDHRALQQVALQEPRVRTGALYVARAADPVGLADACQASVLCPPGALTDADVVAAAHAHRLGVSVWTVNEPAEIARVLRAGVDALTSDYPDRVRASA